MKFSRAFMVKGNIERVFELCERCVSDTGFRVERSAKPTLLILKRGKISGSIFSFNIEDVKTVLAITFSQKEEDVQVKCDYETLYGRLITRSDESVLKDEVMKLKNLLQTALQK